VLCLLCLVTLTACINLGGQSPQTQYFLLPVLAESPARPAAVPSPDNRLQIAAVSLAAYLDRPQIVARQETQLVMADFARWGEPLQDGVARVVADNLERLKPGWRCLPVRSGLLLGGPRLDLDVRRFDGSPGQPVQIQLRWRLTAADKQTEGDFVWQGTPQEDGYAGVVTELGAGLVELSRQLSGRLPD